MKVRYQQQEKTLPMLVVEGARPALLGRNWLSQIRLDWHGIHLVRDSSSSLQSILDKHQTLFAPGLGCMRTSASISLKSGTVRAERVVYCGRRRETEDIFADIRVLKQYAHSRLPVYDRRRAAEFDAPVLRNASSVFEDTTFNGTVEMTRVGTSRDFVRYGAAVFDAPVPRNASNVFEETTFSGTVEMTRVGIRYIRGMGYPGKYCT